MCIRDCLLFGRKHEVFNVIFCHWQNWVAACWKHTASFLPFPCWRPFPCVKTHSSMGCILFKSFGLTELWALTSAPLHYISWSSYWSLPDVWHLVQTTCIFLSVISRTRSALCHVLPPAPHHSVSPLSVRHLWPWQPMAVFPWSTDWSTSSSASWGKSSKVKEV